MRRNNLLGSNHNGEMIRTISSGNLLDRDNLCSEHPYTFTFSSLSVFLPKDCALITPVMGAYGASSSRLKSSGERGCTIIQSDSVSCPDFRATH